MGKKFGVAFILLSILLLVGYFGLRKYQQIQQEKFNSPRPEVSQTYTFRISKDAQINGVVDNLEYYGFIKDKQALLTALEKTEDNTVGNNDSIKIGKGTVDREAEYTLSQSWDAWKIARVLLNEGKHQDCSHGCPDSLFYPELLPGGDPAPTLQEQYEWVKTYEDCVEAKGQLSSEQYSQRTGEPRKCVTPDSREFIQGQEGWREARGG